MNKKITKKEYKYEKKVKEIQQCFSSNGPIFIGQLLAISGADYNNLRQYIIEHNLQLIHLNANKIKKVFINVKTIILNNNMLIIKAPTIEKFNETLEYLKKYEAQLLPLEILITEEEKEVSYRRLREKEYLEYKKEMKVIGTTKEDALKAFTKKLQMNIVIRTIKLVKILNDYNKSNKG